MIFYKKFRCNIFHYYIDETVQDAHSTHTVEYEAENQVEKLEYQFHFNESNGIIVRTNLI